MKKVIYIFIFVISLFLIPSVKASSPDHYTISLDEGTSILKKGDTIKVSYHFGGYDGDSDSDTADTGLYLDEDLEIIKYDESIFELVKTEFIDGVSISGNYYTTNGKKIETGLDTPFVTYTFKVKETAKAGSTCIGYSTTDCSSDPALWQQFELYFEIQNDEEKELTIAVNPNNTEKEETSINNYVMYGALGLELIIIIALICKNANLNKKIKANKENVS